MSRKPWSEIQATHISSHVHSAQPADNESFVRNLFGFVALAGLAASVAFVSPSAPADPIIARLIAFLGSSNIKTNGKTYTLSAALPILLCCVFFIVIIVFGLIVRAKNNQGNRKHTQYIEPLKDRWAVMLILLALLICIGIFFLFISIATNPSYFGIPQKEHPAPVITESPPRIRRSSATTSTPAPWPVPIIVGIMLGGAAAALVAYALSQRKIDRRRQEEPSSQPPLTTTSAARKKLEGGNNIRQTIIECYDEMCSLFLDTLTLKRTDRKNRNHGNFDVLTPREFLVRLKALTFDDEEIAALTTVFEKARYSDEICSETDRRVAIAGLRTLKMRYRRFLE